MADFVWGALPFVAIGISLAILFAYFGSRRKRKNRFVERNQPENPGLESADNRPKEKHADENIEPVALGICLGICLGVAVGSIFKGHYGSDAITYGVCFGLLAGVSAGTFIGARGQKK